MGMVRVQEAAFDPGTELSAFGAALPPGTGAVVSFSGLVRDLAGGLSTLEIEHYPGMTERAIAGMVAAAETRFALTGALVIHRHGRLALSEPIMMVATAAPHRKDAFEAAEWLMDWLKSRAPFWKKEVTPDGAAWVEARPEDEAELARWQV